jgi:hypothetical protein
MILRTTTASLILLTAASAWGEGSAHQNNPYMMQQAMGGDKTAQMMMMMGGGMGGSGGGSGETKYDSKREDLQKALEQPAKEIAKRGDENVKAFGAAVDKLAADASKSFIASTAKDEKLDEKLAAQISALPPSNAKVVRESTDELIGLTKVAADAQKSFVDAQSKLFVNAAPVQEAPVNNMLSRLGGIARSSGATGGGLGAATQARTPASDDSGASDNTALNHTPGANGGAAIPPTDGRSFAPGLHYNPPKGF